LARPNAARDRELTAFEPGDFDRRHRSAGRANAPEFQGGTTRRPRSTNDCEERRHEKRFTIFGGELKRRRVDFDIPVPKKLRKSLGGESLQLSLPVRVLEDMCICWSPKRPTNGRRAEATRLLFSKRPPMSSRNLDRLVRLFNLNVPGTITMENEIPPMLPAQRLFAPSPSTSDPYTSQPRGPTQLPLLSVQRRARKRLRLQIEIVGNPRSLRRRVVNRSCKSAGGVFSSSRSRTDWYGLPLVTVALDPDPTVSPVTTRRQLSIGSE
jgi:hypothetical protein